MIRVDILVQYDGEPAEDFAGRITSEIHAEYKRYSENNPRRSRAVQTHITTAIDGRQTYNLIYSDFESALVKDWERVDMLREALQGILDIGKRDMSNPKYDSYFNNAKEVLEKTK